MTKRDAQTSTGEDDAIEEFLGALTPEEVQALADALERAVLEAGA